MDNLVLAVFLGSVMILWTMFGVLLIFLAYFIACELRDLVKWVSARVQDW